MTALRIGLVFLSSVLLFGCSAPKRYLANEVIFADREQGLVFIGYPYQGNPRTNPASQEDWSLAQSKADLVCKKWEKGKAVLHDPVANSSGNHNYYENLIVGAVYKIYICSN